MKTLWCWRCEMELPMLDEEEYAFIHNLFLNFGLNRKSVKDATEYYSQLTGFTETNINAVFHHRIILYGPPCEKCGKPYRTPQASFCAACGNKRIYLQPHQPV